MTSQKAATSSAPENGGCTAIEARNFRRFLQRVRQWRHSFIRDDQQRTAQGDGPTRENFLIRMSY